MKKTTYCLLAGALLLVAGLVCSFICLKTKTSAPLEESLVPEETSDVTPTYPDVTPTDEEETADSDYDDIERDLHIYINSPRGLALMEASENMDSIPDLEFPDSGQSLNDLRFEGWTKEDYFGNNNYLQAFRRYIDTYLQGKATDASEADPSALQPYKARLTGKFYPLRVRQFNFGGLLYTLTPIDDPCLILEVWIYSVVDDQQRISAYEVQYADVIEDFEQEMLEHGDTKEGLRQMLLDGARGGTFI